MKIWVEVTAVAKAFKWRKSYGVENLDDSALNRFVLVPGEGFWKLVGGLEVYKCRYSQGLV